MLDTLRRGASTWVSKLLLGLLIASFAVWGIPNVFREFASSTVASIGSTKISVSEFDQTYRRELDRVSRQAGRPISREDAMRFGFPDQLLSRLVNDALLDESARRFGVGVSEDELVRIIREDKSFQDANGRFDRNRFAYLLRENGWTEDRYVVQARSAALRQQVTETIAGKLPAPRVLLEAMNRNKNEERVVDYIKLQPSVLGPIADPAPEALAKFYEERKQAFRAPEYRKLQFMPLTVDAIARPDDVTDDDAKAFYQKNEQRFGDPEKRRVEQIAFPKEADAEAALARLKSGTSFDDLMTEMKVKPEDADLGLLARPAFLDAKIAEAAFALPKTGDLSDVVKGRYATVILRLKEIKPAGIKPFEEIKGEIKAEIAKSRAESELVDLYKQIEDAKGGGAKLDDIATRFKLKTTTVDAVDRQGKDPKGQAVTVPAQAQLLKSVFESDVGADNAALTLGQTGFLWFDVLGVTPPRDRTLDEVKDDVTALWKAEQVRLGLGAKAVELVARLQKGDDFAEVAKSVGLDVVTSPALKRGEPSEGLSPAAIAAAFKGPEGYVATALGDGDSRVVLKVKDVSEPVFFADADGTKSTAEELGLDLQTTLMTQYTALLRQQIGPTVDRALLARVVGGTQAPQQNY